jgi:hypothetical protein
MQPRRPDGRELFSLVAERCRAGACISAAVEIENSEMTPLSSRDEHRRAGGKCQQTSGSKSPKNSKDNNGPGHTTAMKDKQRETTKIQPLVFAFQSFALIESRLSPGSHHWPFCVRIPSASAASNNESLEIAAASAAAST